MLAKNLRAPTAACSDAKSYFARTLKNKTGKSLLTGLALGVSNTPWFAGLARAASAFLTRKPSSLRFFTSCAACETNLQ